MPNPDGNPRGVITGRRSTVALTILALVAIAAPHRAGAATTQLGCRPGGAQTITQSSFARVFRLRGRAYGCLFSANRAHRLGDLSANESYPDTLRLGPVVRLAGRFVAYELRRVGRGDSEYEVFVRDLRTGGIRRHPKPYEQLALPSEEPDAGVTDIVLNARGAVAWIVRNIYRSPVQLEVRKADATTASTLLDAGAAIEAASLTLRRDGTLHWIDGGVTRDGTLR
jgi:hypothetical protein